MKFLVTGYGWISRKQLDTLPELVLQSCVVDAELSIDSEDEVDVSMEVARQLALDYLKEANKPRVVWNSDASIYEWGLGDLQ